MTLICPPPPGSYAQLYAGFGDPDAEDFEANNIVTTIHQIAGGKIVHIRCHKLIAAKLQAIWTSLHASGHLDLIKTYDGCYVNRNIRGNANKSLHAFGIAIDLNAADYPLGSAARQPHDLTVAFKAEGFFYGGDFHHRLDGMHYEYSNGVI